MTAKGRGRGRGVTPADTKIRFQGQETGGNPLEEPVGEILSPYFAKRPEVVAVYLFGSRAEGVARPDSDLDLALMLDRLPDLPLLYRLEIMSDLQDLLRQRVDAVLFQEASPLLAFQILRHGRLVFDRNPDRRAVIIMHALSRYYDYKRFHDYYMKHLSRFLKEGNIGGQGGYRGPHQEGI